MLSHARSSVNAVIAMTVQYALSVLLGMCWIPGRVISLFNSADTLCFPCSDIPNCQTCASGPECSACTAGSIVNPLFSNLCVILSLLHEQMFLLQHCSQLWHLFQWFCDWTFLFSLFDWIRSWFISAYFFIKPSAFYECVSCTLPSCQTCGDGPVCTACITGFCLNPNLSTSFLIFSPSSMHFSNDFLQLYWMRQRFWMFDLPTRFLPRFRNT